MSVKTSNIVQKLLQTSDCVSKRPGKASSISMRSTKSAKGETHLLLVMSQVKAFSKRCSSLLRAPFAAIPVVESIHSRAYSKWIHGNILLIVGGAFWDLIKLMAACRKNRYWLMPMSAQR
jgi:hypothetical protein